MSEILDVARRDRMLGANRAGRLHGSTVIAIVVGLAVTAILSWVANTAKDRNDLRLLGLQTQESATVLSVAVTGIETPLASAAEIAQLTNGNVAAFEKFILPDVGTGKSFVSASLWNVAGPTPDLVAYLGAPPLLGQRSALAKRFFAQTEDHSSVLGVTGILGGSNPRLEYAYTPSLPKSNYIVSAGSALPADRFASIKRRSAFSDLNFALYLGHTTSNSALIEASVRHLPLPGPTVSSIVPFGDTEFTFVASANGELGGALSEDIWWLIALVGFAMTLGVGAMSERLVRSRLRSDEVASENGRLYAQQRGVAESLQHALLPQELPKFPGVEVAARYVPGVDGLEIGGDWYDVLRVDDRHLLFVIGDVSGRGLRAASFMAELRFAIRAYARDGHAPAEIFAKLGHALDITRDHHFATVFCGLIDLQEHEVTFVNAGHPNGIVRHGEATDFLQSEIGPPIGVSDTAIYAPTTFKMAPGSLLIGFTDGLVERRGESLDIGLSRVRKIVAEGRDDQSLGELMDNLLNELTPEGPSDDIALLGLRWN